jgi:hypothetical protein
METKACEESIQIPTTQGGRIRWEKTACKSPAQPGRKHCLLHGDDAGEKTMTNQEIDQFVLEHLQTQKELFPHDTMTSMAIANALLHFHRDRLPKTGLKHWKAPNPLHNASELANRSCQRLRKAGKITFDGKRKWEATGK